MNALSKALLAVLALPGLALACPDFETRAPYTIFDYGGGVTASVRFDRWPEVEVLTRQVLPEGIADGEDQSFDIVTTLHRGVVLTGMRVDDMPYRPFALDPAPESIFPLEEGAVHRFEMAAVIDFAVETGVAEITVGPVEEIRIGACRYEARRLDTVVRTAVGETEQVVTTRAWVEAESGAPLGGVAHPGEPGSEELPPYRYERITANPAELLRP